MVVAAVYGAAVDDICHWMGNSYVNIYSSNLPPDCVMEMVGHEVKLVNDPVLRFTTDQARASRNLRLGYKKL